MHARDDEAENEKDYKDGHTTPRLSRYRSAIVQFNYTRVVGRRATRMGVRRRFVESFSL
jgi:hypothetical protein